MKLSLEEILALMEKVSETKLDSFSYRDEDIQIKIRGRRFSQTTSGSAPEIKEEEETAPSMLPDENGIQASSMVGIFYASDTEGGEPLVRPGDRVKKGQVLGIIEAMKLMNEIRSEYEGTVEQVLVENGQLVEYGQPLFRIGIG